MSLEGSSATAPQSRELEITRVFDAPRSLVYQAWMDPLHFAKWWGPSGFTTPVCRIDARVGGTLLYCMRSPEGEDYWGRGVYQVLEEPSRIVFLDNFADSEGNPVPASHYGMSSDWPFETLIELSFSESNGRTTMTLRQSPLPVSQIGEMTEAGWEESFDRLAEYVASVARKQA